MQTYWKDYTGNDEAFWEHEWGKHGTCISTFEPRCYVDYSPQEEVVEYFRKTVELFKVGNLILAPPHQTALCLLTSNQAPPSPSIDILN